MRGEHRFDAMIHPRGTQSHGLDGSRAHKGPAFAQRQYWFRSAQTG